MEEAHRRQFALEELSALFAALETTASPCVLMGGQAANYWARHYAGTEAALREMAEVFPFVSKDADFQGSQAASIALAKALHTQAKVPDFRHAFGNLMAGQFAMLIGSDRMNVEVLRKVPGLKESELLRLTVVRQAGGYTINVLNPLGVLFAKTWNVVNIEKEGRHDAEQLLAMVPCVRAYIREFLGEATVRAGLNLIKVAMAFAELPDAARAAARCGIDWAQILPHRHIAASTRPELVRLRERRMPQWLKTISAQPRGVSKGTTVVRLLEVLARHAEPLCARPAPRSALRAPRSK